MFKETFTEALRGLKIVKKGAVDSRDLHTKNIHKDEIEYTKSEMDPLFVGYVGEIKVIKSKHATEIRDGDKFDRSYNIDNQSFLDIFRKLFLKPKFRPGKKTAVLYKNKKGTWDYMIVALNGKVMSIITVIKKGEKRPFDIQPSKTKHSDQARIIVEKTLNGDVIHKIEDVFTIY